MSKPPSWTAREESLLLLNAYLDHELDAAAVLDVERRIGADATLKAEYDQLLELRTALASLLTKDRASDALRQRIAAIATPSRPLAASTPRLARRYDWRQIAAAAVIAAGLAGGGTYLSLRQAAPTNEIAAIVAGHQRALLATAPFDVASSDRHTVKPWFDSKLALSPQVIDLADAGFPLAGGRVDVVDGKPVPAIVYRRRAHVISVIAVPQPGDRDTGAPPTRASRDGYSIFRWQGHDFQYWAVSDVPDSELDEFVARWRGEASTK
jgi:anti-sigma factor RsiW